MRVLARGTWEKEVRAKNKREPLSVLAQSQHERISYEPLAGLILYEKLNDAGEVVSDDILSIEEAIRKFRLFPTEAREKALWKLKEVVG